MLDHDVPPSAENCHWTVGVGDPDAVALNEAVDPAATVTLTGWLVIVGGALTGPVTVRVAALVLALPDELVKTARYSRPFSEVFVVDSE
ncbi:MAG TPA: hypothetical protein VN886_24500 [Acidimicrobiales bacterium]|nr:hypothetical protein [Acidimicrobiales bacterium]